VVRDLLRELRGRGIAVVLSSHLLSEVELVCDRVAILVGGRIVAQGTPAELAQPRGVEIETADGVRAFPDARREEVPGIVADVVAGGGRVYGVRLLASTLEDAYLEAVGAA
jgi:ABC-2 type transport system ATP-binding protein